MHLPVLTAITTVMVTTAALSKVHTLFPWSIWCSRPSPANLTYAPYRAALEHAAFASSAFLIILKCFPLASCRAPYITDWYLPPHPFFMRCAVTLSAFVHVCDKIASLPRPPTATLRCFSFSPAFYSSPLQIREGR